MNGLGVVRERRSKKLRGGGGKNEIVSSLSHGVTASALPVIGLDKDQRTGVILPL